MIALITGASSGIGKDMAKELARRGYDIILVARNEFKLKEVKKEIEAESKVNVDIMLTDLSNTEESIQLHKIIFNRYGAIDVLINNAGFGDYGEFIQTNLEKEIKMINTNVIGYHILMKLFLKDMVEVNKGYILNVASIAGFMPGPLMATYYSTKAYIVRLTQAVRQELFVKKSKVKVSALCPGPVDTEFNKVANVKISLKCADSREVAKYGIDKMFKNKILIFPKFPIKLVKLSSKIIPDQIMAFFCYFVQKKKN